MPLGRRHHVTKIVLRRRMPSVSLLEALSDKSQRAWGTESSNITPAGAAVHVLSYLQFPS